MSLPAGWTWTTVGTRLAGAYETVVRIRTPHGRLLALYGAPGLVERPAGCAWSRYVPGREEADEDGGRWTAPVVTVGDGDLLGAALWEACAGDAPEADGEDFGEACGQVARWLLGGARAEWSYWLEDDGRVGAREAA